LNKIGKIELSWTGLCIFIVPALIERVLESSDVNPTAFSEGRYLTVFLNATHFSPSDLHFWLPNNIHWRRHIFAININANLIPELGAATKASNPFWE
jgi:hypothetical protein